MRDYDGVLGELRAGGGATTPELRRRLAAIAFARSAAYEAAIARWFQRDSGFPETFVPSFDRVRELPYGENPHQRAAYYAERGARTHLLGFVVQHQGKELSFNNLGDLSAARLLAGELDRPACVIVKHANPCGVAVGDTIEEAYAKALAADPVSAYGGVVVVNRAVTASLAEALATQFVEVLFAPAYEVDALALLASKQALRVLEHTDQRAADESERDYRRVLGGLLVQDRDRGTIDRESARVVCGEVSGAQWEDLLFAWRVVKHVTSNAIVLAHRGQTLGVGAGQMSRVDAVRIAVQKAHELGHSLDGAVLASDAFFPFPDGPKLALDAGIAAFIQPGGSKRDDEVIATLFEAGASMVFTNQRHFRHDGGSQLDVRRHVYFSVVANGRPPTTEETATALDAGDDEIVAAYRRLHDVHALVLHPGTTDIWMANPSASHRHRTGSLREASLDGDVLLGLAGDPCALHADGGVATECACCGERLELAVLDGELATVPTSSAMCSSRAQVVGRHRLHVKHDGLPPVGGAPRAVARANGWEPGATVPAPQMNELARTWWGYALDPGWRRTLGRGVAGAPRRGWSHGRLLGRLSRETAK